jgi:hypothetical protein
MMKTPMEAKTIKARTMNGAKRRSIPSSHQSGARQLPIIFNFSKK